MNIIEVGPGSQVFTFYGDAINIWKKDGIDLANNLQEFDKCFDLSDTRTICVSDDLKEIKRMARNIGTLSQPIDYNLGNLRYPLPTDPDRKSVV